MIHFLRQKKIPFFSLLILISIFFGCNDDKENPKPNPKNIKEINKTISKYKPIEGLEDYVNAIIKIDTNYFEISATNEKKRIKTESSYDTLDLAFDKVTKTVLYFDSDEKSTLDKIKSLPDVKVIRNNGNFYAIEISQPLDHKNPNGVKFPQRIALNIDNENESATNLRTLGYNMSNSYFDGSRTLYSEFSEFMNVNTLMVEFRFFGKSKPSSSSFNWKYLTDKQQIEDLHRIKLLFSEILKGKWASSGTSKGGMIALHYKKVYPQDMDAVLANVAPIMLEKGDKRFLEHLKNTVPDCWEKIIAFQKMALEKREEVVSVFKQWYPNNYNTHGYDKIFEYIVLEYPFSFFQYYKSKKWYRTDQLRTCDDIPEQGASAEEIMSELSVGAGWYDDYSFNHWTTFYYQSQRELGYYNYILEPVKDQLKYVTDPTFDFFAPKNVDLTFDPSIMKEVQNWLINEGNDILYIYGSYDIYTACKITPSSATNSLMINIPEANHSANLQWVKDWNESEYSKAIKYLKDRLELKGNN